MVKQSSMDPAMVLGTRLCKQIGVDPNKVTAIEFRMCIGELPRVTVEMFPDSDEAVAVLRHFRVTVVEEEIDDDGD